MRLALSIVAVCAIAFVALGALAHGLKRISLFFPEKYPGGQWNTTGLPLQPNDVYFTTADGLKLHGWIFRASDAKAPTLIWFHGNGGNVSHRGEIAAEMARRGISVLLFDYRGYGKSEGSPTESGLYKDSVAAYDFAAITLGIDPSNLILYGESLGGPYAAHVAATRGGRGVIIENSFPSSSRVARVAYPWIPLGFYFRGSLRTTHWLNEANVPVLIMHGKRDRVIPYALGRELYDGVTGPKTFLESQTAGHCEIPSLEGARYYDAVLDFTRRHESR